MFYLLDVLFYLLDVLLYLLDVLLYSGFSLCHVIEQPKEKRGRELLVAKLLITPINTKATGMLNWKITTKGVQGGVEKMNANYFTYINFGTVITPRDWTLIWKYLYG